mmetsp:Transcript_6372/g.17816  ORF Transcript_6372/g.17816 Transcript_6372/m.17816 type:complete len:483 (-) Transcript_6372:617-2065(-)
MVRGVVPAVTNEHALREGRRHVWAPGVGRGALARILLGREALLPFLGEGNGQSASRARLACEDIGQGRAHLLPGLEQDQEGIRVLNPLGRHGAGHGRDDDNLLLGALLAQGRDQLFRFRQDKVLAVPALFRMRGGAHHRDVRALRAARINAGRDTGVDRLYAGEHSDRLVRVDEAAASAGVHTALLDLRVLRLVAARTDHDDLGPLRQGQGAVVVFQKHGAVDDRLARHGAVRVAGGVRLHQLLLLAALDAHGVLRPRGRHGEAAIEQAADPHGGEHVDHLLVDVLLRDVAALQQVGKLVVLVRKPHLRVILLHVDVKPRPHGVHRVMGGAPVTQHEPMELELLAQILRQDFVILACVVAVNFVVRAHHGVRAGIEGGLEHRQVDFVLGPIVDFDVHRLPVNLLVVVEEVLHADDDAVVLNGFDERLHQGAAQKRIFAGDRLEAPAGKWRPQHLHVRTEQHIGALRHELLGDSAGIGARRSG